MVMPICWVVHMDFVGNGEILMHCNSKWNTYSCVSAMHGFVLVTFQSQWHLLATAGMTSPAMTDTKCMKRCCIVVWRKVVKRRVTLLALLLISGYVLGFDLLFLWQHKQDSAPNPASILKAWSHQEKHVKPVLKGTEIFSEICDSHNDFSGINAQVAKSPSRIFYSCQQLIAVDKKYILSQSLSRSHCMKHQRKNARKSRWLIK